MMVQETASTENLPLFPFDRYLSERVDPEAPWFVQLLLSVLELFSLGSRNETDKIREQGYAAVERRFNLSISLLGNNSRQTADGGIEFVDIDDFRFPKWTEVIRTCYVHYEPKPCPEFHFRSVSHRSIGRSLNPEIP